MELHPIPVRVVSSGQVYRQMFDAQVQLTQQLRSSSEKVRPNIVISDSSIPLVHKEPKNELLDRRQKTWCHGFPNDSNVENPVLHKQVHDYVSCQFHLEENDVLSREVLNLPDVVKPAKESSGIIERISVTRRKKHESLIEDLMQQISLVSVNIEPRVKEAGQRTQETLSESDSHLESCLGTVLTDDDLAQLSRQDLSRLWDEVVDQREVRQAAIADMKTTLLGIEMDRMNMIRELFDNYSQKLEKVAYVRVSDLHRLLDKEAQLINQTMLSNKRAYANLYMRMICADIERENLHHSYILRRTQDWCLLKRDIYIRQFSDYMKSDILQHTGFLDVKEEMRASLINLNKQRITLIDSLRNFKPPTCTKGTAYQWNQQIIAICQQIDEANHNYTQKIHSAYERTCQNCLDEVERIKGHVLTDKIASVEEIDRMIAEEFLPQIGAMQTKFENEIEQMDNHLDLHTEEMSRRMRLLFLYAQGVAHVWDTHSVSLARQERHLKEKLDHCRNQHNRETKEREGLLDTYMDKMRQDSKEKLLAESLHRVKDILNLLQSSYETFYHSMCETVDTYPDMVSGEIDVYDNNICLYFGLRQFDDASAKLTPTDERGRVDRSPGEKSENSPSPIKMAHESAGGVDLVSEIVVSVSPPDDTTCPDPEIHGITQQSPSGMKPETSPQSSLIPETSEDSQTKHGAIESNVQITMETGSVKDEVIPDTTRKELEVPTKFIGVPGTTPDVRKSIPWDPMTYVRRSAMSVTADVSSIKSSKSPNGRSRVSKERKAKIEIPQVPIVVSDEDLHFAFDELAMKNEFDESKLKLEPPVHRRPSMVNYENALVTSVPSWDETIKTKSGKTFFVLSEDAIKASLLGNTNDDDPAMCDMSQASFLIPDEDESQVQRSPKGKEAPKRPAYIGEFLQPVDHDDTPELWYLKLSHCTLLEILEVKKRIRQNFLEYMEEWRGESVDRARSVVAAKREELYSELDLRLHLHAPRATRAELDIHNVRAAELVMHTERVKRHTEGIENALTELLNAFSKATEDHNTLAMRFRSNIEALESVFINATKSTKLVALQNEVGLEMKKFMKVIRASLREFRKYLDETLQRLRESNARFIKSFRVFSDGGNFSPSELEVYRHKLEKVSQHIDKVEGDIMLELEGMESKRLDQASKVASEFEGRFKYHMYDLVFMEKIARWLTNTQVNIKSQVAASNKQAKTIAGHIKTLARRIDACERPNLDKEQITSGDLNASLAEIFSLLHDRARYLACLVDANADDFRESFATTSRATPSVIAGPKVGFGGSDIALPLVTQTSVIGGRMGKSHLDDTAISMIKNIVSKEKAKTKIVEDVTDFKLEPKEKHRAYQPAVPGQQQSTSSTEKQKSKTKHDTSLSITAPSSESLRTLTRRPSKTSKWDRRFLVFGEEEDSVDPDFLSLINEILRLTLDGLLTIFDIFYKQKGSRPITRPQAIQENFDRCSEVVITKLLSYQKQAESFHNQSLQEFRQQTYDLEQLMNSVPRLVFNDLYHENVTTMENVHNDLTAKFNVSLELLSKKKEEHNAAMRPTLGHPQNAEQLQTLREAEAERQRAVTDLIAAHFSTLEKNLLEQSEKFLAAILNASVTQLTQYDTLIVIDDLHRGDTEGKRYPTHELIRRKNLGLPLESVDEKPELPRGKGCWQGVPTNEMRLDNTGHNTQLSEPQVTRKTTLGHSSTIDSRDFVYQKYKTVFGDKLSTIREERAQNLHREERWVNSWIASVKRIQELY